MVTHCTDNKASHAQQSSASSLGMLIMNVAQELQLQGVDSGGMPGPPVGSLTGPPLGNPFAHWRHDSQHLPSMPSSGATDMQVRASCHHALDSL